MRRSRFLILLFTIFIFIVFVKNISYATDICTSEDYCPPYNDPECVLGCGGSISSEQATNQDYYNISITEQKHVIITMTPATLTNYDLYTMWLNETCPTTSYNNCSLGSGPGVVETCDEDLLPGIYPAMVKKQSGTTYSLSVSCENIRCYSDCSPNPPVDGCSIKCGQTISGLSSSNIQTFKFNIPSRKYVIITMTPATLTNYDLYTRWIPNFCPYDDGQGVGWDCKPTQGPGVTETCPNQSLSIGTYFIKVKKQSGTTYSLSLNCQKVPNNYPCDTGDDCQSNVCINGICGSCNSTYYGGQCSWDAQTGMCIKNISDSGGDEYVQNWNFSISSQGTNAVGVAYDGTYFFVVFREVGNRKVYRYNSDGSYDSIWGSLDVNSYDTAPEGLDVNGTHIFLTGSTNDRVYIFKYDKTYVTSFLTTQGGVTVGLPTSVTFNGSYYWVSNSETGNRKVYRYTAAGVYNNSNFDATPPGLALFMPDGVEFNGTNFFVADYASDKIYFYDSNGNYLYKNFSVTADTYGLEYYGAKFYTVDYNSPYVRSYAPISYQCDYDEACYDNTNYWADCSMCNDNNACDSDVDILGYSRDGSCQGANCCLFAAGGSHDTTCDLDSDCNLGNGCGNTGGSASCTSSQYEVMTSYDCFNTCTCNIPSTCYGHEGSGSYYQMACENCGTIGYYNSSHWNGDSTDYCCNDGNDYRRTRLASVTMDNGYSSDTNDKACCLASNDCVDDGQCTDTTQRKDADADGDQDYCNAGTWVDCMNSGDCQSGQTCQSNDCVSANYLTVESTILSFLDQGKWIESVNVPPIAGGNRQMNVTVIVKNSTTINTCSIRIFNSSGSYSNPTIGPLSGTFRTVGSQIQCYRLWDMEYWRNSGQWNVSVSLSDTVSNFTSKNFTYASLVSLDINVSTIDFSGYPGDRVNSINSYPLGINNTGNTVLTVSINGTDFVGQTDANYKIRVNNITYSKDKSVFTQLMSNQQLIYSNLYPKDNKPIYFNMSIPIGYLNQNYQNNININATG